MTYQVLARKWRPKTFAELAGQEHVVTALSNGLTRGRVHHAYLLTGTRGVGKTTIARILAKSLNCITNGVSATPCGICAACVDIDTGRFVDLLELDAASNTGIDNMREILDNARYAPTVGRYKVYLIDEVHQLSKSAFNAMLKTLEEPPEHVKFVLATTEPEKVPVTVLSRCLQFNLKPLPQALIAERLATILGAEGIGFDAGALTLIAKGARGSMRDALSLLDQAIAYGGGDVREAAVRTMLGAVDRDYVYRIAEALKAGAGASLIAEADAMAARGAAFAPALDELASLFHRIAVAQSVPDAAATMDDGDRVSALAMSMPAESVQLAYQICVQGREDLALAPDEATGFSMTLLRLLAFEPAGGEEPQGVTPGPARSDATPRKPPAAASIARVVTAPLRSPEPAIAESESKTTVALPADLAQWPAFVASLKLPPIAGQLAAQTELKSIEGNVLTLALPAAHKHLTDKAYSDKLKIALDQATGRKWLLAFEVGAIAESSLAAQEKRARNEQQAKTEAAFREEPFVRDVLERFDARIRPDSIKPVR
jgi:DNA polymerase-3 subunit gamma/tau